MLDRLTAALADRYRIERELGAGGMATVYLAADLKHDRKVAIKVLKPELAAVLGAERFVVEIKTTAALSHPHILPLFDSGEAGGFLYYVMPYIEGETIREKLNRETQFGVDEAVRIAVAVADALDYAHRHGVIHRDIKPENILLHDGRPMVMDFGIALAVSAAAGGRMTETGLSLGTPHYMSPEQATAEKDITGRSDVYSLASVLYEMLAGEPPHGGGSAQQIIMKIITETPQIVSARRRSVPPNVAAAVMRSLEKLPADRFASAAEFAAALKDGGYTSAHTAAMTGATRRLGAASWVRDPRTIAALGIALLAVVFALVNRKTDADGSTAAPIRFSVPVPSDSSILSLLVRHGTDLSLAAISDDGQHLAFAATTMDGARLYVRPMRAAEPREVPGGGFWPFFSPDGRSLAFFREAEIWRLDLSETQPTRVGSVAERPWDILAAAWHPDGRILVTAANGLWSLPASGGEASLLIPIDTALRERLEAVNVLPDGRLLLEGSSPSGMRVRVFDAAGREGRVILPGLSRVRVVDDVVIYEQAGQSRASRFDLRRLETVGAPVGIVVTSLTRFGRSIAWVEESGGVPLEALWITPAGVTSRAGVPNRAYRWPRVSPDRTRIVSGITSGGLEVTDLRTGTRVSLAGYTEPVWHPDGRSVITSLGNRPHGGLGRQLADGSRGLDTLLALDEGDSWPTDISPDGKWLVWYGATIGAGLGAEADDANDLFIMDLSTRESRRIPLAGEQRGARFSPDGHWLAYQSTESGRQGIHVRPFPSLSANWVISTDGGVEPVWSPDGRTIYYRQRESVMAVAIAPRGDVLERSPARALFSGIYMRDHYGDISWDIARDGRFLMMRPVRGATLQVEVMLNWIEDVNARLARQ